MKNKILLALNILGAITSFVYVFAAKEFITAIVQEIAQAITNTNEAGAIGFIGGADGPTAIFVSGSDPFIFYLLPLVILGIIFSINSFYLYKKLKN